jgi:hypothetical protein
MREREEMMKTQSAEASALKQWQCRRDISLPGINFSHAAHIYASEVRCIFSY